MNKRRLQEIREEMKEFINDEGGFTIYPHPEIDYLMNFVLEDQVPTKQDKFKPIDANQVDDDGNKQPISNLYIKLDDTDNLKTFTQIIRGQATKYFTEEKKILKPNLVEVIIAISTLERRFKEVDVDNLAKCVLDTLNGLAFEDDSQVSTLISQKFIHEMKVNSILIAITKLTPNRKGLAGNLALYSFSKWKEK